MGPGSRVRVWWGSKYSRPHLHPPDPYLAILQVCHTHDHHYAQVTTTKGKGNFDLVPAQTLVELLLYQLMYIFDGPCSRHFLRLRCYWIVTKIRIPMYHFSFQDNKQGIISHYFGHNVGFMWELWDPWLPFVPATQPWVLSLVGVVYVWILIR